MKKYIRSLLILMLIIPGNSYSQHPVVQSIINQVNIDSLLFFVEELSGEVQTIIGGTPYTILSRYWDQPGNDKAADYIEQKLTSYGLPVINQQYSATGRNVYAVQTGTEFPNQSYIICAHYDDMPPGPIAPGADDNASGTAAVLEAARIFSQYSSPYTVIYALWDEEEIGLFGSDSFATQAANQGDSIIGVYNFDMLAWDSDNDNIADIYSSSVGNSLELSDKMLQINSDYNIGLNLEVDSSGYLYSDHSSFWAKGYSAILLIEDLDDFNPYWHTPDDRVVHFNLPYFHKMARLGIGTLATLALFLDIKFLHTPIASSNSTDDIETTAKIVTGLDIGTGQNGPRLYYRINSGSGWSAFYELVGSLIGNKNYSFTIPGQELNTIVEYYLAAQDEDSSLVVTLPAGGGGFSPPGNIPPNDFFRFYVATSSIVFVDSTMNLNNWTSTGGWDITTEKFTSPPYSITDSPGGNYPLNSNASLTSNGSINLNLIDTTIIGAELGFQAQWDIEEDYDYAQVLISTNDGTNWIPLEGQYTKPGNGIPQPDGEPIYEGTQLNWVKETIDLNNFLGEEIKLQFLFRSDGFISEDGFYVDDINVIVLLVTDVEKIASTIKDYKLSQNYPNPFNPTTTVEYQILKIGFVTLKVYDILGKKVATLVNEEKSAGRYEFVFNATALPSGIYFYQLTSGSFVETKKMILLK